MKPYLYSPTTMAHSDDNGFILATMAHSDDNGFILATMGFDGAQ